MVLVLADATALADLQRHAARYHVARGEILRGWRVALHEALALGIDQIAAFTARALGDQAAGAENAGRMELHELHVLQRQAGAGNHAAAVSGAGMRRGRGLICAAVAAGRQHDHLRGKAVDGAVVQVPGDDAGAGAVRLHDQVERKILDEKLRVVLQRLAIERVKDGVAGAVGRGAGTLHRRAIAEIHHVAAERPLIDFAFLGAREWHAVVFEFVDGGGRLARQIFHGVGVAQPVRPLDGVVHVPLPAVRPHILQ